MGKCLEDTVKEIKEDLVFTVSRDELLAICTKERLDLLVETYDKNFDDLLKKIEETGILHHDLSNTIQSILTFSKTTSMIYDEFLNDISRYSKDL